MQFKELLQEKGYSCRRFSIETGLPIATIQSYCNGRFKPKRGRYAILSEKLGVSIEEIESIFNVGKEGGSPFLQLLRSRGETCQSLARKIDVDQSTVYYWASGRMKPKRERISVIAKALSVSKAEVEQCFAKRGKDE